MYDDVRKWLTKNFYIHELMYWFIVSISEEAVENLCKQAIDENQHVVDEYKSGKAASLNFLIGRVMMLSNRRADFKQVTEIMKRMIKANS